MQTGAPPKGNTNRNQRMSGGSYNKNRSGKKRTSGKTTSKNTRSTKRGSASPVIEISKLLVILWLFSSFLYAFLWN